MDMLRTIRFFFFGFNGRIGRTAFVAGQIGIAAALFGFGLFVPMLTIEVPETGLTDGAKIGYWFYLGLLCLLYFWSDLALVAKRYHDFGESFSDNLFRFVFFDSHRLLLKEGDLGENSYGHRTGL